jgi:hypothetical protein
MFYMWSEFCSMLEVNKNIRKYMLFLAFNMYEVFLHLLITCLMWRKILTSCFSTCTRAVEIYATHHKGTCWWNTQPGMSVRGRWPIDLGAHMAHLPRPLWWAYTRKTRPTSKVRSNGSLYPNRLRRLDVQRKKNSQLLLGLRSRTDSG